MPRNTVLTASLLGRTLSTAFLGTVLAVPALAQGPGGPPPLPNPPVPPQNPITESKRVLGKILFWEEQLSSDNTIACGTCHLPEFGGADPRDGDHPGLDALFGTADDIVGSPGVLRADARNEFVDDSTYGTRPQVTDRNAQTSMGGLWSPNQFWDGRANGQFIDPDTGAVLIPVGGSLENQVLGPPVNDVEMAHESRDWAQITAKLAEVRPMQLATNLPADVAGVLASGTVDYPELFRRAFGTTSITAARIAMAIATYERTLVANQTPWDRFNNGQRNALTPNQVNGLNFFASTACGQCHRAPEFTDNQFHNIGLRPWQEDDGRRSVTGSFNDRGRFKTPSLRNVGLRSNLMHVGWIDGVADALDFYRSGRQNTGHVQFNDGQDQRVRNIAIPPQVLPDLVDFLENGLTDPRVAAGTFPFDRPTLASERASAQPLSFGLASPGTGGLAPRHVGDAPLVIANPEIAFGVSQARPSAIALLGLSSLRALPGTALGSLTLNVDVGLSWIGGVPVTTDASGMATWNTHLGADTSLVGASIVGQWLTVDPAAPVGIAGSRGRQWMIH